MFGTQIDTWLGGLAWVLTLVSLVGLLSVGARVVARRLLLAGPASAVPTRRRTRSYPTVPASEQTGENQRPAGLGAQRSGKLREMA